MQREIIGAQGEITIFRISGLPSGLRPANELDKHGRPIISHSESGHHHVLDRPAPVFEAAEPPAGMRILYALLDAPAALVQDAGVPHAPHALDAGTYEFRIAREFDPFTQQARMVAD